MRTARPSGWRPVIGGVRADARDHDVLLVAAGATFYFAVSVVPLVLVAIRLASVVGSPGRVDRLGEAVAALLPGTLGAKSAVRDLVVAGSRLPWINVALSALPASLYGEGLRRALGRFSPQGHPQRDAPPWRARLLILAVLPLSPVLTLGVLFATAALGGALGSGGAAALLGDLIAFVVGWLVAAGVLLLVYRGIAPDRPSGRALITGAGLAGVAVAVVLVGFIAFLHLPLQVGRAYGGFFSIGGAAAVGGWLLALHVVVLLGYALTVRLDPRVGRSTDRGAVPAPVSSEGAHPSPRSRPS